MNVQALYETLPVMTAGMGGIFIVTLVIMLSVYILNKASSISSKKSKGN